MASTVKRAFRCLLDGLRSLPPRRRRAGSGGAARRSSKAPRVVVIRRRLARRPKKGILKAQSNAAPPPSPDGERRRHVSISLPDDEITPHHHHRNSSSASARVTTRPAATSGGGSGSGSSSGRWRSVFGAVWEHQQQYQRLRQQKQKQKQERATATSRYRSNSAARRRSVAEALREVGADMVALQNVRAEEGRGMRPLSELAEGLGMRYVFAESWAPEYGNAVLSRWPIKRWNARRLADHFDFRNVMRATIEVPGAGEVNLYCTHLDHLDEGLRMKQVNSILRFADGHHHILAGGLNALDASDYSADRWAAIAKYHEEIGKPPPKTEVMRHLKAKRYVDAKDFAGGRQAGLVVVPNGQDVQGTCKYGTRVDYILASPNSPYSFVPGSYAVVPSMGTSDHHIVMVDVAVAADGGGGAAARRRRRRRVVKVTNKSSARGIFAD
uniref:Endonuclease/exonuclease/phosphatase domain-containing protein n=1 Tax=Oryza punctata TaxID=4537 RepID=A0A0E0KDZ4_ORYPU